MAWSGATASRAGKPGGTGGVASASRPWYGGAVVDEKMSASCRRAACWWSASGERAEAGEGCCSAWMRSRAAAIAASVEDAVGILTCDGNHDNVSAIRRLEVEIIQTWKHR